MSFLFVTVFNFAVGLAYLLREGTVPRHLYFQVYIQVLVRLSTSAPPCSLSLSVSLSLSQTCLSVALTSVSKIYLGLYSHALVIGLVLTRHNKIPQTGWINQQKFISDSSGGEEIQDQGAESLSAFWRVCILWRLTFSLWLTGRPACGACRKTEGEVSFLLLLYKDIYPTMRILPSQSNTNLITSPKQHLQLPLQWVPGLQHMPLGDTGNIQHITAFLILQQLQRTLMP